MLLKKYHVIILLSALAILIMLLLLGFQLLGLGLSLRSSSAADEQWTSSSSLSSASKAPSHQNHTATGSLNGNLNLNDTYGPTNSNQTTTNSPSPHQASLLLLSQSSANQNSIHKQPSIHLDQRTTTTSTNDINQQPNQGSAQEAIANQQPKHSDHLNQLPLKQLMINNYPLDHYQQSSHEQQHQQPQLPPISEHHQHHHLFEEPFYDSIPNHRRQQILYPHLFGANAYPGASGARMPLLQTTSGIQLTTLSPPPAGHELSQPARFTANHPTLYNPNENENNNSPYPHVLHAAFEDSRQHQPAYHRHYQHHPFPPPPKSYQATYNPAASMTGATVRPYNNESLLKSSNNNHHNNQLTHNNDNDSTNNDNKLINGSSINLLAEPEQQELHRQQMLDPHFLFNKRPASFVQPVDLHYNHHHQAAQTSNNNPFHSNNNYNLPLRQSSTQGNGIPLVAPGARFSGNQLVATGSPAPPPYAHPSLSQAITNSIKTPVDLMTEDQSASNQRPTTTTSTSSSSTAQNRILPDDQATYNSRISGPGLMAAAASSFGASDQANQRSSLQAIGLPYCASSQNISSLALICHEDPEYPTKEIMRALEMYANSHNNKQLDVGPSGSKSLEQLLPQSLIWLHLSQSQTTGKQQTSGSNGLSSRQQQQQQPASILSLDSLQKSISSPQTPTQGSSSTPSNELLFPSNGYTDLCRSSTFMSQPRRAKNLLGQWKIIVNLPGHKYRGIAISQMVRIEECTKPLGDCQTTMTTGYQQQNPSLSLAQSKLINAKCLQEYDSQRLLAWSRESGLHMDIFRIPISCSCHIMRSNLR